MPSVHCMMVISLTISKVTVFQWSRSSSQSENTAHVSCEEFTHDFSDSNNLCHHVDQVENALTKMIQSLIGVIAKFESLVDGMQ